MGKIRIVVLLLVTLFTLSGCDSGDSASLNWGSRAFECEISWERGGEHIRAVLICGEGVAGERDISLRFEEPRAMRDICVIRESGVLRAELDGVTVNTGNLEGWLDIEYIFDTEGDISYLSSDMLDGEATDRILLRRTDGGESEIYLSRSTELPVRIITRTDFANIDARIIYFSEKTEM
ncbi:MAG: hypothetical protein J6A83_01555 [Clostridia bacterium]|nr:hypothetical protein [Clostridia bacterium]